MYSYTRIIELVFKYMSRGKLDSKTVLLGESLSKKIKSEREKLKLSQSQLSNISSVPLDTLRSIENGRIITPSVFIADNLVKALRGNLDKWLKEIRIQNGL